MELEVSSNVARPPVGKDSAVTSQSFDHAIITGTPLFGGMPEDCRSVLTDRMQIRSYAQGEKIFVEGEPAKEMFVLAQGALEISREGQPLVRLVPGDFFGEVSFLDMQPRGGTATAMEEVVVYVLPYAALRQLYQVNLRAYALIVMNLGREVCRRLRKAEAVCAGACVGKPRPAGQ